MTAVLVAVKYAAFGKRLIPQNPEIARQMSVHQFHGWNAKNALKLFHMLQLWVTFTLRGVNNSDMKMFLVSTRTYLKSVNFNIQK